MVTWLSGHTASCSSLASLLCTCSRAPIFIRTTRYRYIDILLSNLMGPIKSNELMISNYRYSRNQISLWGEKELNLKRTFLISFTWKQLLITFLSVLFLIYNRILIKEAIVMLRISEGGHVWKLHKLAKSNVISFLNYFQPENLGLYHGFF